VQFIILVHLFADGGKADNVKDFGMTIITASGKMYLECDDQDARDKWQEGLKYLSEEKRKGVQ
jgi:hypothetical protein